MSMNQPSFPLQIQAVLGPAANGLFGKYSDNDVITLNRVSISSSFARYTITGSPTASVTNDLLVDLRSNDGTNNGAVFVDVRYPYTGTSVTGFEPGCDIQNTASSAFTNSVYTFLDIARTTGGSKYQDFVRTQYSPNYPGGFSEMFGTASGSFFRSFSAVESASASESPSESASESSSTSPSESTSESSSVSPSESSSLSPSASESPSESTSESASESASESPSPAPEAQNIQIMTKLNKVHRVSRAISADGITATPGLWVELSDGKLQDITTSTPGSMNKFPFDPGSNNIYESHDKRVGRITTIENDGARVQVNIRGYVPGMAKGDDLVVSVEAGQEGKLKKSTNAAAGTYEVVARCEEIDNVNEVMTWSLVSPRYVTIS